MDTPEMGNIPIMQGYDEKTQCFVVIIAGGLIVSFAPAQYRQFLNEGFSLLARVEHSLALKEIEQEKTVKDLESFLKLK